MDGHDVRVLQVGGRFRLSAEAPHLLFGGQIPGADHLHGDDAIQSDLPGLVHHAHPAAPDLLQHLIIAEIAEPRSGRNALLPVGIAGLGHCNRGAGADFDGIAEIPGRILSLRLSLAAQFH